jgi:hypothetical protein
MSHAPVVRAPSGHRSLPFRFSAGPADNVE